MADTEWYERPYMYIGVVIAFISITTSLVIRFCCCRPQSCCYYRKIKMCKSCVSQEAVTNQQNVVWAQNAAPPSNPAFDYQNYQNNYGGFTRDINAAPPPYPVQGYNTTSQPPPIAQPPEVKY